LSATRNSAGDGGSYSNSGNESFSGRSGIPDALAACAVTGPGAAATKQQASVDFFAQLEAPAISKAARTKTGMVVWDFIWLCK
jgi:hypothetical protein